MKKFGKFILGIISFITIAGGIWYFFKNVINKDNDEFEDFDDDFDEDFEDDFEYDDIDEDDVATGEDREYVKITIADEDKEETESKSEEESDTDKEETKSESEEESDNNENEDKE